MNSVTEELVKSVVPRWEELKKAQNDGATRQYEWSADCKVPVVGDLSWNNPDLLFVFAVCNEDGYEGSATQLGITRDGRLMYEYQSHCSCNSFENSSGEGDGLLETELTKKSYQIDRLPEDWETQVQNNIKELLK